MDEEKTQVVSLRLSEDIYGKLKVYAETQGQNVSDVTRLAIEKFISGVAAPSPGPPPVPGPGKPEGELRRQLEVLAGREEETRRYVEGMAWRLNDVQATVNKIMAILAPYLPPPPPVLFPGFPAAPWVSLSDASAGEPSAGLGESP